MMVGVPGYDPGRLQPSAAPAYKAEPHASADAVATKMVRASGFEPPISCARGTRFCLAKLHPDENGDLYGNRTRLTGSTVRPPRQMRHRP
jgi:hypothetical protein